MDMTLPLLILVLPITMFLILGLCGMKMSHKLAGTLGTIGLGVGLFKVFKNVGINMLVAYLSNLYCFELPTI